MKFLLAPDSYKGSLTAKEVSQYMEGGIKRILPDAEVVKMPIADGGEGTVNAFVEANDGEIYHATVTGPANEPVKATFGTFHEGKIAVIEMAEASGLTKISPDKLNPLLTTTYGTGELIIKALDLGCEKVIIGLGGSATNDGGMGMAQALGVRFFNKADEVIQLGNGGELKNIDRIDISQLDPRIEHTEFIIASDVTNPLCGENGASAVFGPQKGATPEIVKELDEGLAHYAQKIKEQMAIDILDVEGAGAAGGLGAGLLTFVAGKMKKGIDIVIEYSGVEEAIRDADYVFTGEGYSDNQTKYGKAPFGIAQVAKKYHKPVFCISGGISLDVNELYDEGFDVIVGAVQSPMTLEDAMEKAGENVEYTTATLVRALCMNKK